MQEIDDYYQALLLKNIEERAQKLISRNDNDETDLKSHPGITWKTVVSGLKSCSASYSSPGTAKQLDETFLMTPENLLVHTQEGSVFMDKKFKDYTFIAHNAKGYNGYFIVSQLLKEKMGMKLIAQGGKLMCIEVTRLGIRFIDSLNFLPMKLNRFPQAIWFEGCKGYFRHVFNMAKKQNYVGPLPKMEYYGIENMMSREKGQFLEWYQNNRDKTFDMQKKLVCYCQQDVKNLKEVCCLYRDEIMKMTQRVDRVEVDGELQNIVHCIDPFQYITLASVCMAIYKFMFLKPQTIALLPPANYYRQKKRFSTPSI
ncbi:hypothetical protein Y1Q_0017661 [Alligator mississippiensis]|uniref:DNA-directed DNA polymerase n=1 Tax=Alligator mississippiensis TaxID=8496 RepID=A0A151N115_ALLMI|nr:hypothetical protein Y1Q_0017661 [Alligator mississippiensis]